MMCAAVNFSCEGQRLRSNMPPLLDLLQQYESLFEMASVSYQ